MRSMRSVGLNGLLIAMLVWASGRSKSQSAIGQHD